MSDDLVKRLREGDHFEKVMSAEQAADRIEELEAKLEKAVQALDDLISTYVWVREDEYERGWGEMSNAVHEATFVQMELTGGKDE